MLKIIADDLGLHKSVNDGIIFLLKENKIDGASLMANGEAFEDAVKQISDAGLLNVGIHLNLVEQRSVLSGELMSKNHKLFFIKYVLGLINWGHIQKELEAQIKKCTRAGIKPAFINGNQHLHLLPGIMSMCIKLAKEYHIQYIRIVNEPVSSVKGKLFRRAQLLFLNFLSSMAKKKIRKADLQCNDYFVGFINAGNLGRGDIKFAEEIVVKNPDKIVELGCHPGHEIEELNIKYRHWGNYNWQKELELLK
ncbi:MAG: hypothetical protein COV30_01305 [Candidatus Yanofskybacteria bacterium CG10_big_fil_rev_8_21_14_0_10_37_15]|uniref:ChbG/HpnK family deacetylase n=1 Tax=Candidatus Yanofskybacteria bacterium CG10_big_fil_rev_8_21_14_0_10_37_15 TaxID=1975097 RepID=A0A2H0R5N9_9BACT|nr:MAG: hypothetical protein COV30_01305 [Candidatus Yanofskybacteria bacterium CG10_big_fil_rev_8_21_14_0_10_37_15]